MPAALEVPVNINLNKTRMKIHSLILIFAAVVLSAASCRSTKNIHKVIEKKDTVAAPVNAPVPTHDDTVRSIHEVLSNYKQIQYTTFAAKIKVEYYNSKGRQPGFVANIRMRKDSIIWISLSNDLGIEGFRVMINADSIRVMDKLANTYQVRPLSSIQDISQIPFSFSDIQELLVGNPVFFNKDSIIAYGKTEKGYTLVSAGAIFKNLLSIGNNYYFEKSKLDDVDHRLNRTADISYFEYENKAGFPFSTYREIFLLQQNKLDVQMKFKDYRFEDELTFPFNVPKKFKRIQ
ncbi:MAG: DUF4292 domain-containing protein [Chitinophagaceae bacterium]|nr:DUF4292 domain-containing protein [Chitinophagaceae bacterium]